MYVSLSTKGTAWHVGVTYLEQNKQYVIQRCFRDPFHQSKLILNFKTQTYSQEIRRSPIK